MGSFETLCVCGFEPALHGMRLPLKSYKKADSYYEEDGNFIIGPNDYKLMENLWKGGTEHRKYLRQIVVWVDIEMPRYFFQEWDTYKIGTSANSESTMHRLIKDGVNKDDLDFPWGVDTFADDSMNNLLYDINNLINIYKSSSKEHQEKLFLTIKGLLPEAFMQKRTVCLNYEVLATMYKQRKHHRLPQWNTDFINWIKTLPYPEFIIGFDD